MKTNVFASLFITGLCLAGVLQAQTVTLDYYFNHEVRKDAGGTQQRYHYLWEDQGNTGFSVWGDAFKKNGATLASLETAPTAANLKNTAVYIIVDPDNAKESAHPNYIKPDDALQIAQWVKAGGILVLMANDSANVELPHFNTLAQKFGLHFNNDIQNHVMDDAHFNDGSAIIKDKQVFKTTQKVFLKDACGITSNTAAKAVLTSPNGTPIAVIAPYGKGMVFAAGDPWLYNEYVNGRLPHEFENDKAAADLARWLVQQARNRKK